MYWPGLDRTATALMRTWEHVAILASFCLFHNPTSGCRSPPKIRWAPSSPLETESGLQLWILKVLSTPYREPPSQMSVVMPNVVEHLCNWWRLKRSAPSSEALQRERPHGILGGASLSPFRNGDTRYRVFKRQALGQDQFDRRRLGTWLDKVGWEESVRSFARSVSLPRASRKPPRGAWPGITALSCMATGKGEAGQPKCVCRDSTSKSLVQGLGIPPGSRA